MPVRSEPETEHNDLERLEALIDPCYRHLIELCRRAGLPCPEVGYSLMVAGRIVADAELAWEDRKFAMVLEEGDQEAFRAAGWTAHSPEDFEKQMFTSRS